MRKKIALLLVLLAAALSSRAQTGTWSGKIDVHGTKLTLVFHLDEGKPSMDSPDQGAKGIPIEVERSSTGSVTIKIPSAGATYEGLWMVKKMVGTFNQAGTSFPLTLTPGAPKVNRPQTPAGPFPYTQEEVTFTNGEAVLSGTLTLPENYTRETPVLIMVTGSGLQNRDEEIFEHKPFAVIADAFARAGIATLRYDDRGIGKSEGDVVNCTTEDFKEDALAGVKLLKDRFDRVGVLGHSEGGSIAMMLAAEGHADFIISLAGGVVSGSEVLIWQNSLALSEAGMPEETVRNYLSLLKEAFDACVSDKPMPSTAGRGLPDALAQNYQSVVMQLRTPYMRYFLSLDMRPLLDRIKCPVLALNGSKDRQVEPESNIGALRSGLPVNPETRVEVVEGLNHMFQHCTTGAVAEYKEIEETIAPEVLAMMIRWIL